VTRPTRGGDTAEATHQRAQRMGDVRRPSGAQGGRSLHATRNRWPGTR